MSEILASPMFLLGTLALVLVALAFVLVPLWRRDSAATRLARKRRALEELRDDLESSEYRKRLANLDREHAETRSQPRSPKSLSALLIIAVPLLALFLYTQVGTPEGIEPEPGPNAELREVLGELTLRVRQQPQDIDAWNRLGMIWKQMQQYPAAEAAFRRVMFIDPSETFARVELAETLLYASGRARLPEASRELLDSVLVDDPDNQKALWLAGLGAFHDGEQQRALALWTRLRDQLPDGNVRDQVSEQIARVTGTAPSESEASAARTASANPHAGIMPPAREASAPEAPGADGDDAGASIRVEVQLDQALAGRISGNETVFVFARAVNGPPAPLAVKRFTAADLPATVVLSDGDSMAQGLSLSTFPQVQISARVSRSGNAIAAAGDLQGQSGPLTVADTDQLSLVIDEVIE